MKISTFDYENPFRSTNADTMSYEQIVNAWSEPFFMKKKMVSEDLYLRTPISLVISGARGTGKTMMFKFYSIQSQMILAEKNKINIFDQLKKTGSVSFYLKFDPYILQCLTIEDEEIFIHLFELLVCEAYIDFLNLLRKNKSLNENFYQIINNEILELMTTATDVNVEKCVEDKINAVYDYLMGRKIKEIKFETEKIFPFCNLSYNIKEIMCEHIQELKDLYFFLIIDEGENFLEFEQKMINRFIKTINSGKNRRIYFRLGTREPILKTSDTINSSEFLTIGRDFEFKDINYCTVDSTERKEYMDWLLQIAEMRLRDNKAFSEKNLFDIRVFLGNKEDQCKEARECASNKKKHFEKILGYDYSEELYDYLKVANNPLLEMMNIFWHKKGRSVEEIKIGVAGYLGKKPSNSDEEKIIISYRDTFKQYKVAFLYLLLSKYKKEKRYYTFQTYSYLSVGNVCNFIKLCREAFDNAYFEDQERLFSGRISIKAQHMAAMSVAFDEIEKVKYIPQFGTKLYSLVINLGNYFHECHSDNELRTIERNQFAVPSNDPQVQEIINAALTWGVFLRKPYLQNIDSIGKITVYVLNKMFCPLFGISYRSKERSKELIRDSIFLQLTEITNASGIIRQEESQVPGQISLFAGGE